MTALALHEIQAFQLPSQPPDAPEAVCATRSVEPGELLLVMRTAPAKPCQRTADELPRGGSLCPKSELAARDKRRQRGSPGVGNRHAGKYREWTLSRQRGGSGANATPLPTKYLRLALVLVSRCAQRVAHLWHCHPIESGLQDLHSPCTSSSDGERVVPTAAGVKGVRHITLVVVPRCVWVWWSVVCSPVRRAEWPQR